jgi:hypothetical protein
MILRLFWGDQEIGLAGSLIASLKHNGEEKLSFQASKRRKLRPRSGERLRL